MDIKGFIEWVGHDLGSATATVFPYVLVGIMGLYLLYLVVGYLRATQVGLSMESHPAGAGPILPPPSPGAAPSGFGRGVPYCPTDQLAYAAGVQFCPRCEGDLLVDCANCGTTIRAADPSCFHCGTRDPLARVSAED
ncbi:MAG: hypothetical protein ACXWMG_06020 [Candidatus Limnocylindria bacterium]